ncbi:hypothetical protein CMV_022150 [Castanea mollissima]|uniref:CCHC-type domain-containing protein n=1 Tax=Castanea mollissima TaxID=60419 RepID=A0A8J4QTE9_9ROSI|nr:hypothetical protein CMV_022150 [Castanea mollissima]
MSANNKEPETVSLCDMVDDLVHDESEINEDQNNVDLSLDDSNQPFACNRHSEPHLDMHIVHDISSDVVQVEPQVSSTMMRNSLMLQFLEVAEVGSQSEKQYKHLGQTLRKVHEELLAMQDVQDVDDLGSPDNTILNSQVLSNLPMTLRDPPHVPSKGRPKALRQKHPKEKQLMKKRKCSICKETGHVRTNCPTHKHSRDVANTSLTPHSESMHQQQSQTEVM